MTSLREKIVNDLENKGLISKNQATQAFVTMFSAADEANSFAVCGLTLQGIGPANQADIVTVSVEIEGEIVKTAEVAISSGELREFVVTLPKDIGAKYAGKEAECTVAVQDTYYRTLSISSGEVRFGEVAEAPVRPAESGTYGVSFVKSVDCSVESARVKVAEISAKSASAGALSIDVFDGGAMIWHDTAHVKAGESLSRDVRVMKTAFDSDSADLRILVRSEGRAVLEKTASVSVLLPAGGAPAPVPESADPLPMADGDLRTVEFVDVQESVDGASEIGEIIISNRESKKPLDLVVSLSLDGRDLYESRDRFAPGKKKIAVSVPVSKIADEDMHNVELNLLVCDSAGRKLSCRTATVPVKSKFDLDLRKLAERVPKYVNPRDRVVSSVIQDTKGGLAKAMGDPYIICGYQNGADQLPRMVDGLYRFLRDSKISYVSDTFSICATSDAHCYQRVKSAARTYETRNGNCIELSILFASFLEAMDLEPVILLPPGHAMVGVVLETNVYDSKASVSQKCIDQLENVVRLSDGDAEIILLPIEATMVAFPTSTLKDASASALETIQKNGDDMRFVFIPQMRSEKRIYPMAEL